MDSSWNTPHLVETPDGKQELAVTVKKWVLGFDPATGRELWRCEAIPDYICPSIVSDKGVVYAMGGRRSMTVAIRSGGRGDVSATHKLWQADVGANVSSPVVHDGHLYWVSDRNKTSTPKTLTSSHMRQRFWPTADCTWSRAMAARSCWPQSHSSNNWRTTSLPTRLCSMRAPSPAVAI